MDGNGHPSAANGESGDAADLKAVSETLRGNRNAFRSIVERHGPLVLRLAASFLRDPDDAEEASQEIFFKVFRSLHSFNLEKAFLPWLYSLAINHLRTSYRTKRRREDKVMAARERDLPSEDGRADPVSVVEAADARSRLRRAIETLPAGVREVVSLYYLGGLSVSRIAASLGIGSENVKSRLHRGRKGIRTYLSRSATRAAAEGYTSTGSEKVDNG